MPRSKTNHSKAKPAATKAAVKSPGSKKAAAPEKALPGKVVSRAVAPKPVASKPAPKKAVAKKTAASAKPVLKKVPAATAKPKTGAGDKTEKRNAKLRAIKKAAALATDGTDADSDDAKRNFGLRGAAPWVARHAAKHAEELRKRNAEPPPPGSARATLRTPKEAEEIKSKISLLHQRVSRINALRKKLDKSFFEIGDLLAIIQSEHLFEAKGYATFEAFLDREIEVPRITSLKLVRIVHTFDREAAHDYPLERLINALGALDGELSTPTPSQTNASGRTIAGSSRGFSAPTLPAKPPIRWD